MYKKMISIVLFIFITIYLNINFKIKNYITFNLLAKDNSFYTVIDDSLIEKIVDKKEFIYKDKKYNFEIIKIDKNMLNNQVISTLYLKSNVKCVENLSYKVNIKINEVTLVDYIFNYLRGKL